MERKVLKRAADGSRRTSCANSLGYFHRFAIENAFNLQRFFSDSKFDSRVFAFLGHFEDAKKSDKQAIKKFKLKLLF